MNEKEAQKMIDEISEWLKYSAKISNATFSEIDKSNKETVYVFIARRFSNELLDAAGADGRGGCQLCQS